MNKKEEEGKRDTNKYSGNGDGYKRKLFKIKEKKKRVTIKKINKER
ncbi:hypothetical protein [Clostridioides difficile]|nr:hypothetical protein [Clostridioides difficile]